MDKPIIEYPCHWEYRVVGSDEAALKEAVASCLGDCHYRLAAGNKSSQGKYISLGMGLVVSDEKRRDDIYASLSAHPAIKMVL